MQRASSTPVMTDIEDATAKDGILYGVRDVSRLFGLPESRLRYWSQTGFIEPSVRREGRVLYTFQDLVSIKVAKGLLDAGLPLQRVRRSLGALRLHIPRVDTPLSSMRIRCDHDRVVVDAGEGKAFEASTGQMLLDFDLETLREEAAEVVKLPWVKRAETDGERTAYEWFLHARDREAGWDGGDEDDPAFQDALRGYRRAVELDPAFAAAWTNLGSLHAETGDLDAARDAFDHALRLDPAQPEAQSNLAELALRDGDVEVAISGFRHVLRANPEYVEAHYGLARALLAVGGKGQALAHLERFCVGVERIPVPEREPELGERLRRARAVVDSLRRELRQESDGPD